MLASFAFVPRIAAIKSIATVMPWPDGLQTSGLRWECGGMSVARANQKTTHHWPCNLSTGPPI